MTGPPRTVPPPLLLATVLIASSAAASPAEDVAAIEEAVERGGLAWQPGLTGPAMGDADQRAALGSAPPPTVVPLWPAHDVSTDELPARFDWRDTGGNFTTPIRDQGWCGSCWAFAALGAVESLYEIAANDPALQLDLSEQVVLSCSDGDCWGWFMENTLDFVGEHGAAPEECLPYVDTADLPCSDACGDWIDAPYAIDGYEVVPPNTALMKEQLLEGPLVVWMATYDDLLYYAGGVYEPSEGTPYGGHFVLLVGWDEAEGCWIAKNSWGSNWGEDTYGVTGERGWFRIAYEASAIQEYAAFAISVEGVACVDGDGDGWNLCDGDCDDQHASVHPGADEVCDGLDNDCDGAVLPEEADADNDGFVPCTGDCDDSQDTVNPQAREHCEDSLDNDCDGLVDRDDGDCASGGLGSMKEAESGGCDCGARDGARPDDFAVALLLLMVSGIRLRGRRP